MPPFELNEIYIQLNRSVGIIVDRSSSPKIETEDRMQLLARTQLASMITTHGVNAMTRSGLVTAETGNRNTSE